jgi:hypothetical protein
VRRLLPLALLLLLAAPALAQSGTPYALLFKNRTCGPITVKLESRMACQDLSTGCRFPVAPEYYREVALRFRERIEWMTVHVQGSCAERPPSVTVGTCALPMGKLFPWNDIRLYTGYVSPFGDADMQPYMPADNAETDLANPVEIDIMLAECDDDRKPVRCRIFCRNPDAGIDNTGQGDGSGDFN